MRYSYRRPDAVVEGLEARRLLSVQAPALDLQFEGQHVGTLPDGSIAVSSDYVVQVVNFGIAWYAKGSTSGQVEPLGSIFGQGTRGDAQVVYDPYNQRFVVTAIGDTPTGDNAVVVAVSKTADPSQADGWWVAYVDTAGSVPGFSSVFLDQPRVAVGADALYICGDGFATGDQPTSMDPLFAVLKDPFYSGGTLQSSELLLNGSYWAPVQPYGTLPPGVGDFVVNATFADPNGVSHFDYQVVTEDPTQQTPTARFGLGFGFPQDVVEPPSTGPVFDGADPNFSKHSELLAKHKPQQRGEPPNLHAFPRMAERIPLLRIYEQPWPE